VGDGYRVIAIFERVFDWDFDVLREEWIF